MDSSSISDVLLYSKDHLLIIYSNLNTYTDFKSTGIYETLSKVHTAAALLIRFPYEIFGPICHLFGCPSQNHDAKKAVVLALFSTNMLFCLKMSRGMGIFHSMFQIKSALFSN